MGHFLNLNTIVLFFFIENDVLCFYLHLYENFNISYYRLKVYIKRIKQKTISYPYLSMPFEKKGGCIGAEATFCTNEKLTRLDKKKD